MASLQSSTTASGRWRRALGTVKAATSLRSTSKRASRTLENLDRSVETDIEQGNKGKFVSSRTKNAKLQRNLEKTGVHGGAFDHVVKMYQNCNDSEEGFKNSVVQWSAAYYDPHGRPVQRAVSHLTEACKFDLRNLSVILRKGASAQPVGLAGKEANE